VFLLTYGTHFGNAYPSRRWSDTRIRLMKDGMARMLRMGMGKRKSAFRPREEGTGTLSEEAKEEEGVRMDPVGGEYSTNGKRGNKEFETDDPVLFFAQLTRW